MSIPYYGEPGSINSQYPKSYNLHYPKVIPTQSEHISTVLKLPSHHYNFPYCLSIIFFSSHPRTAWKNQSYRHCFGCWSPKFEFEKRLRTDTISSYFQVSSQRSTRIVRSRVVFSSLRVLFHVLIFQLVFLGLLRDPILSTVTWITNNRLCLIVMNRVQNEATILSCNAADGSCKEVNRFTYTYHSYKL